MAASLGLEAEVFLHYHPKRTMLPAGTEIRSGQLRRALTEMGFHNVKKLAKYMCK